MSLTDNFQLSQVKGPFFLSLLTAGKPEITAPGIIGLAEPGLRITFSRALFSAGIETIEIEDSRLRSSWGEKIYRIVLTLDEPGIEGEYTVEFRKME